MRKAKTAARDRKFAAVKQRAARKKAKKDAQMSVAPPAGETPPQCAFCGEPPFGGMLSDDHRTAICGRCVAIAAYERPTARGETLDLKDALIELQAASWARSWSRLKAVRMRVRSLLGFDVVGPLTADQENMHEE